jgi:hypothetical protein
MAYRNRVTVSTSRTNRALTAAERREATVKRIAGQQSQLKREAAERRAKLASDAKDKGDA